MRLLLLVLLFAQTAWANLSDIVYLTFEESDTSHSISIHFHVHGQDDQATVYWGESPQESVEDYQKKQRTWVNRISRIDRSFHHTKLNGLDPEKEYYFRFGSERLGFSKEYRFRTLSRNTYEIDFITGGDMSTSSDVVRVAKTANLKNVDVILMGGDLAYADGRWNNYDKWEKWFENLMKFSIQDENRIIPLILAIGNHETTSHIAGLGNRSPIYPNLFPQARDKTYFSRELGEDALLLVLDSGHITSHKDQRNFIRQQLAKANQQETRYKLALYHAPLYANTRGLNDLMGLGQRGRKHWLPLFDEYHLTMAFENHDHTLKVSKVLRNHRVAQKGTVYFGDGCWGASLRSAKQRWYLEVSKEMKHIWSVSFLPDGSTSLVASGLGEPVSVLLKNESSDLYTDLQID